MAAKKTKRKEPADSPPLSIRLQPSTIERLDALVPKIATDADVEAVMGKVQRSVVLRLALLEGLRVLERRYDEGKR